MLYLLWTLLNIGLIVLFYIICFKATKLIREKLGVIASIFFVFGLLSFISNSTQKDNNNSDAQKSKTPSWTFKLKNDIKPNTTRSSFITIDKNFMSSISLMVLYAEDKNTTNDVAVEANSVLLGFVSGHSWRVENISVDTTSIIDKLKYNVFGTMKWQILGTTIYSQPKLYTGVFETNK